MVSDKGKNGARFLRVPTTPCLYSGKAVHQSSASSKEDLLRISGCASPDQYQIYALSDDLATLLQVLTSSSGQWGIQESVREGWGGRIVVAKVGAQRRVVNLPYLGTVQGQLARSKPSGGTMESIPNDCTVSRSIWEIYSRVTYVK